MAGLNRRKLLIGGAGLAATSAAAWGAWPEQGLWNPCRAATLPPGLADHELVKAAWDGIDAAKVWDAHAHLVGMGDSGSGITVNPDMTSLLHPFQYMRRRFFLNAGCAQGEGGVDRSYVARMRSLVDGLRPGAKLLLFAFERTHGKDGKPDPGRTDFWVPDAYVRDTAKANPQHFEWAASIHPYRADCVEALERAKGEGARAVKWLPAAMGMDPGSEACDRFFAALARLDVPLITHAGMERAVHGADAQEFGNPLRLRRALDAGVRVVVAHCASMGKDRDTDKGDNGPMVESFELFARMMDDKRYGTRLYGDISAMPQKNRADPYLVRAVERTDWHPRLLNGSDYPLPGVMPLFSVDQLVELKLLQAPAAPVLREIRAHNPILFDFVLKRHLRSGGKGFSREVFETRGFFGNARLS